MSLSADRFIVKAIKASQTIKTMVKDRIFDPARTELAEKEDRVPYIIVSLEGGEVINEDKDSISGDTGSDLATVSVLCCANDRKQLCDLTEEVRKSVNTLFESDSALNLPFDVEDYTMTYDGVQYDPSKPCMYQTLTYKIETQTV